MKKPRRVCKNCEDRTATMPKGSKKPDYCARCYHDLDLNDDRPKTVDLCKVISNAIGAIFK